MYSPAGSQIYTWLKTRIEEEKVIKLKEGKWLD